MQVAPIKKLTILLFSTLISFNSYSFFGLFDDPVCIETDGQTRNGIVYLPNHFYGFTGKNLCFYKNGQIKSRGKYENGKKVGVWTWWYENGQIKRGEYYE